MTSSDPVIFDRQGPVLVATVNRPEALNALTGEVEQLLVTHLETVDRDPDVKCIVVAGTARAFAAGADIKELQRKSYLSMHAERTFSAWDRFAQLQTPKVAAVGGYALGGGCELAMMCDIIVAAESARFGQPELRLGLIPGMGGTQRLTRLIGRTKAMDMILTGRMIRAEEADRIGLVSRVVPDEELMPTALSIAGTIAGFGGHSVVTARDCVARAEELNLAEGLREERQRYFALFDTADAIEGMGAFVDKREPRFC